VDAEQNQKLNEWTAALAAANVAKLAVAREQELRKEVMALFFPAPEEGVNNLPLEAGWTLKATHKLERKLDEAALPAVLKQLREMGVNPDTLIRTKPELETKAYKSLAQINPAAVRVFEQALTIKPGSPVVELIPPKVAA